MGPLDTYLPYLLNRAGARIAAAFGEEMRPLGASLQMWRVLAALRLEVLLVDVEVAGGVLDEDVLAQPVAQGGGGAGRSA